MLRNIKRISITGLVFFLLGLAFFVRFSNLERKFYWIDEVSSSFVITGYWPEYIQSESDKISGQFISVGQFQHILESQPSPSTKQVVTSLLDRDPQHSPLYFMLAQKWSIFFGVSPNSLRMVSAILSFVGIPIFAWLCAEIFGSFYFGIIGLLIISLAPFHILFSQQNREYGLWFTVCALSTALLLMVNRKNNKYYWIAYGISVAVSLYTFLFSLPFLLSHLLFQWLERKEEPDSRFKHFLISFGIGILSFVPWMINIFLNLKKVLSLNEWSSTYLEPALYVQGLILNFSRLFLDLNLPSFQPLPWDQKLILSSILITFAIIIASFMISIRLLTSSRRILLASMFIISFLFLLSMDIFAGKGIHALVGRQLMPAWISVYLAVTFAIGFGLRSASFMKKGAALGILILVLVVEAISTTVYIRERHWWALKPKSLFDDAVAIESLNPDLLVTSEIQPKQFISMSYSLKPDLPLIIMKDHQLVPNLDKITKIALYNPSEWLIKVFNGYFTLENVTNDVWLGHKK